MIYGKIFAYSAEISAYTTDHVGASITRRAVDEAIHTGSETWTQQSNCVLYGCISNLTICVHVCELVYKCGYIAFVSAYSVIVLMKVSLP